MKASYVSVFLGVVREAPKKSRNAMGSDGPGADRAVIRNASSLKSLK